MSDPETVKSATEALETVRETWMARKGVVSVEVARRWIDGVPTDEVGIRVTVRAILPEEEVPDGELFPETLQGFPVDLFEGANPAPET